MNPNKDKIGWCDFTWNPVVGCYHWKMGVCKVGERCYALRMAKRKEHICQKCYNFEPHLHPERLKDPYKRKKAVKIFVGSMTDLFGDFIPREWIEQVIQVAIDNPQHTFMFLTKNPKRYNEFIFPENCWLGVTVNCQADMYRISDLIDMPYPWHNLGNTLFVSFEPLYSDILFNNEGLLSFIDWFIIGAQTNPTLLPDKRWVHRLIKYAIEHDIPVFLKDNLGCIKKKFGNLEEFPDNW